MDVKIALIGGGNVGQGFLAVLRDRREQIIAEHGISFQLVAICDRQAGSLLCPQGLKIREVLPLLEDGLGLQDYAPEGQTCVKGLDPIASIELSRADVVIECTFSDMEAAEPATTYIRTALAGHKHVITSNKGPVALHFDELNELARANGVVFHFGSTVMSGTPVMAVLTSPFFSDGIRKINGVLNVSTNVILDAMEKGAEFDEAVKKARDRGLLEANLSLDIEGYDSLSKLLILVNVLSGKSCDPRRIVREGMSHLSTRDVQAALEKNMRYRMVSTAWKDEEGNWEGQVGLFKLEPDNPLYWVSDTRTALRITSENLGEISLEGPGAGKQETGFAILAELLSIYAR